ncbi:MAG: DUF3365 domain-containing protein [Bacteroidetes bacterium]|nr:DUF3365 domain-containing protein [Bacteroidota bacterium]
MKFSYPILIVVIIVFFSACKNEKKEESPSKQEKEITEAISKIDPSYQQIGLNMAFTTKAKLGENLMRVMKEKGAVEALQFCKIKANTITDSMATVHNARIKRVSDKTRNPNNKPNEIELKNIAYFKNVLSKGEEIAPIIETINDSIYFYYPIITNEMCLKCHGTPNKEIDQATLLSLKDLYPTDKAVGYSENQVRGIWSIQFQKQ